MRLHQHRHVQFIAEAPAALLVADQGQAGAEQRNAAAGRGELAGVVRLDGGQVEVQQIH